CYEEGLEQISNDDVEMVDVTDYIMDTEIVIRDEGEEDGNPENRAPTNGVE
ncbi:3446_t:CDS:1, partial [Paraglomus brasilianum]